MRRPAQWVPLAIWAACISASGCHREAADIPSAATEQNRALVRRWIDEGFNRHDPSVVDELFSERVAVNGRVMGRDDIKQNMRRHFSGFPDLHVTIAATMAEGNRVGIWYTVQGTHQGAFEGIPPTGIRVTWAGTDLFSVEGGRISEARFLSDVQGLLSQLGVTVSLPRPSAPAPP